MDGTVSPKGSVGSWEWAEKASEDELMSWLVDGCDPNRSQHTTVLVEVERRLPIDLNAIVDIVYSEEAIANRTKPKKSQAESIMDIIKG